MSTDVERQRPPNGGRQVNDDIVHIPIDPSVTVSASASGVELHKARENLRERARIAIRDFKTKYEPLGSHRDQIRQDIKPFDEYPVGYPKLAAVEAFEKNFLIYKKFGWLHNRVALRLQDELLLLEQDLVVLDEHDAQQDPGRLYSRRRDEALDSKRKALLDEIEEKLHHFDKLILRMNRISKLETPSERNQRSVYNFIHNTGSQVQSESEWVEDRADLVAVVPDQERSVLNAFVEELPKRISRSMTTFLFRTEDQARRIGAENINLYSQKRFDFVANALITFISTLLLLIPIGVLYLARISGILQLVVILCFTQVFGLCIACMTKARKQEVFAVTAAYTAVLVVFLANNNAPSVESS